MSDVNASNQVLPTPFVSSTEGNTSLYESNGMSTGGSNKKRRSSKKKGFKKKPSKCGGRNKKSRKNRSNKR